MAAVPGAVSHVLAGAVLRCRQAGKEFFTPAFGNRYYWDLTSFNVKDNAFSFASAPSVFSMVIRPELSRY